MAKSKHKLELNFDRSSKNTKVTCKCGEKCGEVVTGTKPGPILEMYRKHIKDDA